MCFNIVNIGLGLAVSGKTRKILGEMPAINQPKWTSHVTSLDVVWEQGPLSRFLHPNYKFCLLERSTLI